MNLLLQQLRSLALVLLILPFLGGLASAQSPPATGSPETTVQFDFQEAEVRHVFSILAEVGGLNFIADDSVTGKATFSLKGLPVHKAIDLVARTLGLGYIIVDNTLIVASPERIAAVFEEHTVERIELQYITASHATEMLGRMFSGVEILATPDEKSLLVSGNLRAVEQVKKTVAYLDRPSGPDITSQAEDLVTVLQRLAEKGGFDLIVDEGVRGRKVTAVLQSAKPREAVDLLIESMGLVSEWRGNTLLVHGNAGDVAVAAESEGQPSYLKMFHLNYAPPEQVQTFLSLILPESQVQFDKESRILAIRGTRAQHDVAERVIASFDQPPAQVFIEARVQEVSRDTMRNLKVTWNSPGAGASTSWSFGRLEMSTEDLSVVLEALEEKGYSHLLAAPQITTISGKMASIFIGDRVPVILHGSEGAQDVIEYIEAGVTLEITPYITADGAITCEVKPEVASIAAWTDQGIPQIRTRKAQTTVRVKDGQPIVIGGLIRQEDRENMQSIPFLGELPLLSKLFAQRDSDHTQMETVIFLIPHIVTAQGGWSGKDSEEWVQERSDRLQTLMKELAPVSSPHAVKIDVLGLANGAIDLELETPLGQSAGAYTKVGCTPVTYGTEDTEGWKLGIGGRAYYDEAGYPLWVSLGVEGLWVKSPADSQFTKPYTLGVTELGLTAGSKKFFLEPHLRWSRLFAGEDKTSIEVPGYDATAFGLRVGYSF